MEFGSVVTAEIGLRAGDEIAAMASSGAPTGFSGCLVSHSVACGHFVIAGHLVI